MKKIWGYALGFVFLLLTAAVWSSPVPDTGQMTCYDAAGNIINPCPLPGQPFYGQDACYAINPLSYTKLDGSGNALPDSAASWAMIRDNVSGLIWENKTGIGKGADYSDPHNADNTYTWYDGNPATNGGYAGTPGDGSATFSTQDFVNSLNSTHFGGYSDWRLPTVNELTAIINFGSSSYLTTTAAYFPNTQMSAWYWSSASYADDNRSAWGVAFLSGSGYDYGYTKSNFVYARAVRGGQPSGSWVHPVDGSPDSADGESWHKAWMAAREYSDNGNGTVTDNSSGLMWQQTTAADTMIWEDALSYCENLNLGGYTDWRLPTVKELNSLVDSSIPSPGPTINTALFPDTQSSGYWTSTTSFTNTGSAWIVFFDYGNGYGDVNKSVSFYVRAVRAGQIVLPTPSPIPASCTATLDNNLALHIPYITDTDPSSGNITLTADFSYEFNPELFVFKYLNSGVISNPSFSCPPATLSSTLAIRIPDVLLSDGVHVWAELSFNPVLSTDGNDYFVVTNYGPVATPG